jgi:hypothetical protein
VLEAAVGGLALILDADGASIWLSSPAGAWEGHLAAPLSANPDELATQFDAAPVAGEVLVPVPGEVGEPGLVWAASGPDDVLLAVRRAGEGWPPDDAR